MVSVIAAFLAAGTPIAVDVRVAETEITVAQQLLVEISVRTARNSDEIVLSTGRERAFVTQVVWPQVDGFTAVENSTSTKREGDEIVDTWRIVLEPLSTGERALPALTLRSKPTTGSGPAITTTTEPIPLKVRSLLGADPGSAEVRPPAPRLRSWGWLWWTVASIWIAVAVATGFFWLQPKSLVSPPDAASLAREKLLRTIIETAKAGPIRAALLEYQAAVGAEAGEVWKNLDKLRFAREEQAVDETLKTQIREFAQS